MIRASRIIINHHASTWSNRSLFNIFTCHTCFTASLLWAWPGQVCEETQTGSAKYDPSSDGRYCGWKGPESLLQDRGGQGTTHHRCRGRGEKQSGLSRKCEAPEQRGFAWIYWGMPWQKVCFCCGFLKSCYTGFRLRFESWYIVYKIAQVDLSLLKGLSESLLEKQLRRDSGWCLKRLESWERISLPLVDFVAVGWLDSCLKQMTVSYCDCFWGTQIQHPAVLTIRMDVPGRNPMWPDGGFWHLSLLSL